MPPPVKPKPVRPIWKVQETKPKPTPKPAPKPAPKPQLVTKVREDLTKPEGFDISVLSSATEDEDWSTFTRRVLSREQARQEMNVTVKKVSMETSETSIFKKAVTIKKVQPPAPDKLLIQGELYPKKPKKGKRVRIRKQVKPKSATYQPVPYVPGPFMGWIPERKDVLMAAKAWTR